MSDKKLISFCVTGRNDNYLGNFKYRISTAINYLAWCAKSVGVLGQIEVIVTDWNSDNPLCESVKLSPDAASISYFIQVFPDIARKYHYQYKGQKFNSTAATNAAVRRASGQYIVIMPSDSFFPSVSLLNFVKLLKGEIGFPYDITRCLLKISRRIIPHKVWETEPDIEELEASIINISGKIPYSPDAAIDITSGLGGIVASRNLWHLARGCDEKICGWGHSDTEFGLRIEQVYPGQELSHYGVWVYDLYADLDMAETNQRQRMNPQVYHNKIEVNSVDWGLGNESLETKQAIGKPQFNKVKKAQIKKSFEFEERGEMISRMANKKYHDFLIEHLPFSKVFRVDWKLFYPLIWYGLTYKINKYLELGVSGKSGAPIAVLANSCVDIFVASEWEDESLKNRRLSPLDIFTLLNAVDFMEGRCRFIEGDVNTALERIDTSSGNKIFYDLVLFQPDIYKEKMSGLLENVMEHLSDSGAIVIAADSAETFVFYWKEAKKKYPLCTFVHCFKDEIGIILKSGVKNGQVEIDEEKEMEILKNVWRPVKKNMAVYFFVYGLNLLEGFFKKCFYEPFWRWPVRAFCYFNKWLDSRRNIRGG